MKHLNIFLFTVISLVTALSTSCSTDFELNADYDEIPIIFGVLDQSVDTQFVKINKSFIGNGDNNTYAAINDSSIYSNVIGRIEEYVDGDLKETFQLEEMWVNNLDEGIFYTDSQKVFFFIPTAPSNPYLNEDAIYKLIIDTDEEAEQITAETELVKGSDLEFAYLFTIGAQQFGLQFADASTLSTSKYLTETASWETVLNGKKYELKLRVHFKEVTATTTTSKFIEISLGSQESTGINGGETMTKPYEGEAFYAAIANKLDGYAFETDVLKRVIDTDNIEFIITSANDILNTYIEINEPSTGVVTESPVFTNIEGGVGIFASRVSENLTTFLDSHSANVLCAGPLTGTLKFCIDQSWDGTLQGHDILVTYPSIGCP